MWWDGIYWFDGERVIKLTRSIDPFFKDTINQSQLVNAFSVVRDGEYRLAVSTGTNTTPDKIIVLDFKDFSKTGKPLIRIESFSPEMLHYDSFTGKMYGGFDNVLKEVGDGFTESISLTDQSKDFGLEFAGEQISMEKLKVLNSVWLWVNTKSINLTLKIYIDFALEFTKTINTSSMQRVHVPIGREKCTFISFSWEWEGIGEFELLNVVDLGVTLTK